MNFITKRRFLYLISIILLFTLFFITLKLNPKEPISCSSFKLNTFVSITIYDSTDENLLKDCLEICDEYELLFSKTNENSEIYQLNHRKIPAFDSYMPLSYHTSEIIRSGLEYSALSDGNFSIALEPLTSLWDFSSETVQLPSKESISEALPLLDYQKIEINGSSVRFLEKGMGIDLGGIAKGYIADRIKEYLLSRGIKSAMINLGGNVLCLGNKPDGSNFEIGIQKPFAERNESIATLQVTDKSVVSSGVYERYFEVNNKLYHHILNPQTGYPYDNGLLSVTIVSDNSIDGDALSTACFALGIEDGMALIESLKDVDALFITEDYVLHYSKGFEKKYLRN